MTPAEALALWTGRMGLRKGKGRRCICWARGTKCQTRLLPRDHRPPVRPFCFPPLAVHMSVWGLGQAPGFRAVRVLCSQPPLMEIDEAVLEEWCAKQKVVCWDRPDLSWHRPGTTTLQVFASPVALSNLVAGDQCPCCRATDSWAARECCGVGDLAGWWDAQAVAEALMS